MAEFTLEDVSKHSTPEDCWLVVDNTVWDLTKFLNVHPGGRGILLPYAGKDATEVFYSLHNAAVLDKYRSKLCKGVIAGAAQKFNQKQSPPAEGLPSLEYKTEVPFAEPSWIRGGGWKSPYHNESHIAYRHALRALIHEHIVPTMAEDEDRGTVPSVETYQAMGRGGLPLRVSESRVCRWSLRSQT